MADLTPERVRELLAELEHEQWIAWSKNIAQTEILHPDRVTRWQELWRPYAELTEKEKDQDRKWADKVLAIVSQAQHAELESLRAQVDRAHEAMLVVLAERDAARGHLAEARELLAHKEVCVSGATLSAKWWWSRDAFLARTEPKP